MALTLLSNLVVEIQPSFTSAWSGGMSFFVQGKIPALGTVRKISNPIRVEW